MGSPFARAVGGGQRERDGQGERQRSWHRSPARDIARARARATTILPRLAPRRRARRPRWAPAARRQRIVRFGELALRALVRRAALTSRHEYGAGCGQPRALPTCLRAGVDHPALLWSEGRRGVPRRAAETRGRQRTGSRATRRRTRVPRRRRPDAPHVDAGAGAGRAGIHASGGPGTGPRKETPLAQDSVYRLTTKTLEGQPADLGAYAGKVALVVNVASQCGYTPQYAGLEQLYGDLKGKGFVVLGFPSNDFGGQEPGTAQEIRQFCSINYNVTFPLFDKVVTKAGAGQSPVYANLQKQAGRAARLELRQVPGRQGRQGREVLQERGEAGGPRTAEGHRGRAGGAIGTRAHGCRARQRDPSAPGVGCPAREPRVASFARRPAPGPVALAVAQPRPRRGVCHAGRRRSDRPGDFQRQETANAISSRRAERLFRPGAPALQPARSIRGRARRRPRRAPREPGHGGDENRLFALAELSYLHAERAARAPTISRRRSTPTRTSSRAAGPRPIPLDPRTRLAAELYNRGLTEGLHAAGRRRRRHRSGRAPPALRAARSRPAGGRARPGRAMPSWRSGRPRTSRSGDCGTATGAPGSGRR